MIKYMVALKIKSRAEGAQLSNYNMPYWNTVVPTIGDRGDMIYTFSHDQRINIDFAAHLASSGQFTALELRGHYQRIESFLSRANANELFQANELLGVSFGEGFLVCPIRADEILAAPHPGYPLLPLKYYADIFEMTKLTPVFCGQTEPSLYMNEIRRTFPAGVYLPPQGMLADFQTIRKSRNIILPVSTFAWMAAWLSDAAAIYLPVYGLFNPKQYPDHDLLPLGDERYQFFRFPVHQAVPVEQFMEAHASLRHNWCPLSVGEIAQMKAKQSL